MQQQTKNLIIFSVQQTKKFTHKVKYFCVRFHSCMLCKKAAKFKNVKKDQEHRPA